MKTTLAASLLAVACLVSTASAQRSGPNAPDSLSFQGLILRGDGTPLDSNEVNFTFALYKGDTKVWEEVQQLDVIDGIINVQLGKVESLDTVAFNQPIDLGIKLGVAPEISPRTPLTGSAYALGVRGFYSVEADVVGRVAPNVIAGASNNYMTSNVAGGTISGGGGVEIAVNLANSVTDLWGTVGGGGGNTADDFATVSGGKQNSASFSFATIGGGRNNAATASNATVSGGWGNVASGGNAWIGGGRINRATGGDAMVPGGWLNQARGGLSFAAGTYARAAHDGTFVWNNRILPIGTDSLVSTGENQFLIGAEGGVGINTNAPANAFHVVDDQNGSASVGNHVAVIDNTSTGSGADVLALRVGRASAPENTNAFISFKYNGNTSAGFIRGEGTGGIELVSEGADYAEYLPHRSADQVFESGEVVGVFAGEISRQTDGADQIMVVSTSPIVLGNHTQMDDEEVSGISPVAFIGQAPVNVRGSVAAGDFLVPSGSYDGTAVAVDPARVSPDQLPAIFATAWESKTDAGVGKINAAIGIDQAAASRRVIAGMHRQIEQLKSMQHAMLERLMEVERRMMP